jgi:hypothetical protein
LKKCVEKLQEDIANLYSLYHAEPASAQSEFNLNAAVGRLTPSQYVAYTSIIQGVDRLVYIMGDAGTGLPPLYVLILQGKASWFRYWQLFGDTPRRVFAC